MQNSGDGEETNGVTIRSINRAFSILVAVNQYGPVSVQKLANACDLPYPTTHRIVRSLVAEGLIETEPVRKLYRVTEKVKSLSSGFRLENEMVLIARPYIEKLCLSLKWPIAITTRVNLLMMVRDSTHNLTTLTFTNYFPGHSLPIEHCASGKAYMAFCSDAERQEIAAAFARSGNGPSGLLPDMLMLDQIRREGFALQQRNLHTADPGKTSSIAVPVLDENGCAISALALIYFASAMKPANAVERYFDTLTEVARAIGEAFVKRRKIER